MCQIPKLFFRYFLLIVIIRFYIAKLLPLLGRTLTLILLIGNCFNICYALSSDAQQKLKIRANVSQINYKSGINIYEGNVQIDQGSSHLVADRVVAKVNGQHEIQEVIAYGIKKTAEYTVIPKPGDDIFRAKANIITYNPVKSIVTLKHHVTVAQGKNSFQGELIIYNIKDQTIDAPASKGGQSTIIIDPDKLKS